MWPWEHLAVGYLFYSGGVHLWYRRPPTESAVFVLALATQLPDLVDKPLAWSFRVLPHGLSLAHSLVFAVPFLAVVALVADRYGRRELGVAATVGYLSHLASDVLYGPLTGGRANPAFLLWPLIERPAEPRPGLVVRVEDLFESFLGFLGTPTGRVYLAASLAAMTGVLALWVYDGAPVGRYLVRRLGVGGER